jgi:tRNA pseudouridine32 synthase/23S rRNA pseudouridine746 synthase/23S rRNA pseudouridine1911/1915/1917 synthase
MTHTETTKISLLDSLETLFPESSKNTLKKWIRAKRIYVDNHLVDDQNLLISPSCKVTLGPRKEFYRSEIEILYEDKDILVIYKPTGLLSVATEKEGFRTAHNLLRLRNLNQSVYPVHRLDKDTSGVMVFAKHENAKHHLKNQFEKHTIYREYRAIASGIISPKKGTWQSYLIEDKNYVMHECEKQEGAEFAITDYEVLKTSKKNSLVKFILHTGKKNQIRVQAAHRGHALLGDPKYGNKGDSFERLALHALAIEFIHPTKQKKLYFSYPCPKEFDRMFG